MFCFSAVVRGYKREADIQDGTSGFNGLQNGNELVFGEKGFTHNARRRGHNVYVGRSLIVNGQFCRDTCTRTTDAKYCISQKYKSDDDSKSKKKKCPRNLYHIVKPCRG